jgi:hypothetical protein
MGTIHSIHKDIRKILCRKYLNKYDMAMLLWAGGKKTTITYLFFNNCICNGYINLMDWIEHGERGKVDYTETIKEWINRDWEDSGWFSGKDHYGEPTKYLAIKTNKIEVLEWIYARDNDCFLRLYYFAAEIGKLETLKWLNLKYGRDYFEFQNVADGAIDNGHLDILIWIKSDFPEMWSHLETVYMYDDHEDPNMSYMIELAFDGGQLEIFRWLANLYPKLIDKETLLKGYSNPIEESEERHKKCEELSNT